MHHTQSASQMPELRPALSIKRRACQRVRLPSGRLTVERGPRLQYQNIDGLVDGPFGHDVLDPCFVHICGPPILEDGACCVEVLRGVHLVCAVEEEIPSLICHSLRDEREVLKNSRQSLNGQMTSHQMHRLTFPITQKQLLKITFFTAEREVQVKIL